MLKQTQADTDSGPAYDKDKDKDEDKDSSSFTWRQDIPFLCLSAANNEITINPPTHMFFNHCEKID